VYVLGALHYFFLLCKLSHEMLIVILTTSDCIQIAVRMVVTMVMMWLCIPTIVSRWHHSRDVCRGFRVSDKV
jgi:hypothetical protein